MVRDITCAIWCSNKGMTEAELVEYIDVSNNIYQVHHSYIMHLHQRANVYDRVNDMAYR